MTLTWRQLVAYNVLNDMLDKVDRAHDLWVATLGAQGEWASIKQSLMELTDGN
jgi:hypothetical protein